MNVIKKVDSVAGTRFWRQDYTKVIPAFEVFRVVGHDPTTGIFYFLSLRNKSIIKKSFHQLNLNGFMPFLYEGRKDVAA